MKFEKTEEFEKTQKGKEEKELKQRNLRFNELGFEI